LSKSHRRFILAHGLSAVVIERNSVLREKLGGIISRVHFFDTVTLVKNMDVLPAALERLRPSIVIIDPESAEAAANEITTLIHSFLDTLFIIFHDTAGDESGGAGALRPQGAEIIGDAAALVNKLFSLGAAGDSTHPVFEEHFDGRTPAPDARFESIRKAGSSPPDIPLNTAVLVSDDDLEIRKIIVKTVQRAGLIAVECARGDDALARAAEIHPRLIITDFDMPGLDGLELLTRVRSGEWGRNIPAILCSGNPGIGELLARNSYPNTVFLRKPFEIDDLALILDTVISFGGK
jgi:CheY-like chemotaxis protein